jgi:hypothetical protein
MPFRSVCRRPFGSRRGQAATMEVGLTIPWLVLTFIAVLDFGFCAYGLIATEDAARIGAAWGAASSSNAQSGATFTTNACTYALAELQYAPNMNSVSTCTGNSPVRVSATFNPSGADTRQTVTVTVTYTMNLLQVPAVSQANLSIQRSVQLPVM